MFEEGDNEDFKLNILAVRMGACLKMFAKEEEPPQPKVKLQR